MSYLERTLMWFLKNRIFGGVQKLKQKEYILFALIVFVVMLVNTIFAVLFHVWIIGSLELIRTMLIFELFLAFAIIITGIVVGRINNIIIYYLLALLIIFGSIFAFFSLTWTYDSPIITFAKLFFFFAWILISGISLFFLTLYFFTSFPKKVITLGMPKDHIFFGSALKIVALITLPLYIYMFFQGDPSSIIFGCFGVLNSLIVLGVMKGAPKKVESKPGAVNFATALGVFNMSMFYHLIMSFGYTNENAFSLVIEIIMLLLGVLYLVQVLTRRISESPDRPVPFENPVQFQSRVYFTHHMKKTFGERGVVLMVLGIALGYHMVYLSSFFVSDTYIGNFPILATYINPGLKVSDLYHRIYLILSFIIILIAWLTFKSSSRFKEFMVDKFTVKQVFRYIGGFFMKPEGGESPFEIGVKMVSKKIGDNVKSWTNKWRDSIDKLLKEDEDMQ